MNTNRLTFIRPQSGQSRMAVALGWEEKWEFDYWYCIETQKLYRPVKNGFAEVEVNALARLQADE